MKTDQQTLRLQIEKGGKFGDFVRSELIGASLVDPTYQSKRSRTSALMVDSSFSSLETALGFVKDSNDIRTEDILGRTPLYHASSRGNIEIMRALLDRKITANDESLHVAAK